jgi:fermentation-respiration switch protein FrsA (DUF1100 family)
VAPVYPVPPTSGTKSVTLRSGSNSPRVANTPATGDRPSWLAATARAPAPCAAFCRSLSFAAVQPEIDADRLGIYGTSYGGATVVFVAAIDPRVKCVVSVVGIGNGQRWMRSVRRPDEYYDLLERAAAERAQRALTGVSEFVERSQILLPDRQSADLAAAARRQVSGAVEEIPLEFVDDTLSFNPEWVVDRIAPRPMLFITSDNDRLVPPAESEALYARAGEPKRLVVLKGCGHYEVYAGEPFRQVMEATTAWYGEHLPAQ